MATFKANLGEASRRLTSGTMSRPPVTAREPSCQSSSVPKIDTQIVVPRVYGWAEVVLQIDHDECRPDGHDSAMSCEKIWAAKADMRRSLRRRKGSARYLS